MQAEEYHETVHQNPEDGKRHRLAHDVANVVVGTFCEKIIGETFGFLVYF